MRILKMSEAERGRVKSDCIKAIDYMWRFIQPLDEEIVIIEKTINKQKCNIAVTKIDAMFQHADDNIFYNNIKEAIFCNKCRLKENNLYMYDYTYLTPIPDYAADYAQCSWKFGEIGQIAYRFWELIEKIKPRDWNPAPQIKDLLDWLRAFVDQAPEPVIVEVSTYNLALLYSDTGEEISEEDYDDNGNLYTNLCYKGGIKLSIENAIPLNDFVRKMIKK